jgi:hypothetical protein
MFEPGCNFNIQKGGKQKEDMGRMISAMMGVSAMVESFSGVFSGTSK